MSKIELIKALPWHAYHIAPLECYDEGAADRVCDNIASGLPIVALTLKCGDTFLGIIGANLIFTHSATYWAYFDRGMRQYPKETHKILLRCIEMTIKSYGLQRVQTFVDVGNEIAVRHNERMGFQKEGILRKHGFSGRDQYIFSRVT